MNENPKALPVPGSIVDGEELPERGDSVEADAQSTVRASLVDVAQRQSPVFKDAAEAAEHQRLVMAIRTMRRLRRNVMLERGLAGGKLGLVAVGAFVALRFFVRRAR